MLVLFSFSAAVLFSLGAVLLAFSVVVFTFMVRTCLVSLRFGLVFSRPCLFKKYYQTKFFARFGLRILEEVAFIFLSGGRVYFVHARV